MLFMVVEHFKDNDMLPVYRRMKERGRQLPDGLIFKGSWIEPSFARCFQLMECEDLRLLQEWILGWSGTGVTFEVCPVLDSSETRALVYPYLDQIKEGAGKDG